MEILGGLLLLFGGVVMVYHERIRRDELRWFHNPIMRNQVIATIVAIVGFVTGFYSIYYWVHHFGWIAGLISWVTVGILTGLFCNFLSGYFPLILITGFVALGIGYYVALYIVI